MGEFLEDFWWIFEEVLIWIALKKARGWRQQNGDGQQQRRRRIKTETNEDVKKKMMK